MRILLWNAHVFASGRFDSVCAVRGLLNHDIVIFTETLAPPSCEHAKRKLSMAGYVHLASTRRARSGGRRSGGVSVFLRDSVAARTREVARTNEPIGCESLWIRIEDALPGGAAILLGACYVSPQTSPVYEHASGSGVAGADVPEAVFGMLTSMIDSLRRDGDEVILAGDFNARTGGLTDVADPAEAEVGYIPPTEVPRLNSDTSVNAFGRRLVQLCSDCDLAIMNGRVGGDRPANMTCVAVGGNERGASAIDLFIASRGVFASARQLRVLHSWLWGEGAVVSDHCPVLLKLDCNWTRQHMQQRSGATGRRGRTTRFDVSHKGRYQALFDEGSVATVKLERLITGLENGVDCDVSIDEVRALLSECCQQAFTTDQRRNQGDAPWWNAECSEAWHAFRAYRREACDRSTGQLPASARPTYKALLKAFKRVRRAAIKRAELAEMERRLRDAKANPRGLWTWLKGGKAPACLIDDADQFTTHFERLLNGAGDGQRGLRDAAHQLFVRVAFCDEYDPAVHDAEDADDYGWARECIEFGWETSRLFLARRTAAGQLNAPITEAEVGDALKRVPNNKSAGLEHVQAECYKYALRCVRGRAPVRVAVPYLAALFNRVLVGSYPQQWRVSTLTPVFKKGDAAVCDNYRGIAVGGALAKLYASVLARRISKHCEDHNLRAVSQAGCRSGFGTEHHLFTLRHLIAKHSRPGARPLIVMQIDFAKAFDSVDHETLWAVLEMYGIHGQTLDALRASYQEVRMRVKVNGRLGQEFTVGQGVKQGCPLSVVLFGLFIEMLAHYIDAHDTDCKRRLPDRWRELEAQSAALDEYTLTNLLFVDDASLVATGYERARCLLELLADFCRATGMVCNATKCEVLVFGGNSRERKRLRAAPYVLCDQRLRVLNDDETAKYLGLTYGSGRRFTGCTGELLKAGRRAMHSLLNLCRENKIYVPKLRLDLFWSLVVPVFSYGAQVWGPDFINVTFESAMTNPMVEEQRAYMRAVVGARCPTHALLYRELAQRPLQYHWAKLVLRFWNGLTERPGTLCHRAFVADLKMAIEEGVTDCWSAGVLRFLADAGVKAPEGLAANAQTLYFANLTIPISKVLGSYADRLDARWRLPQVKGAPREFPCGEAGVKLCRYVHWMGDPVHGTSVMAPSLHQTLTRFRLGCWETEVNRPNGRARCERTCKVCGDATAMEDELHVFCECPCYEHLRDQFEGALQFKRRDMITIMKDAPPAEVAAYLQAVWDTRHAILRRRALKRGRDGNHDPLPHPTTRISSMAPPALTDV